MYGVSYFFSEVYVEPLVDEEHKEEIKHNIPYNDKNDHHFKEEKNCKYLKLIVIHL